MEYSKYLLFSDTHHEDTTDIIDAILHEKPTHIIFAGDANNPHTVEDLLEIKKMCANNNIEFYAVRGNHDEAVQKGIELPSKKSEDTGYSTNHQVRDIEALGLMNEYKKLLNKNEEYFDINNMRTALIHGGFAGELSHDLVDPHLQYRLMNKEDAEQTIENYMLNFKEMNNEGMQLLIRGHDHDSALAKYIKGQGMIIDANPETEKEIELDPNAKYILTIGSVSRDNYAIIEVIGEQTILTHKNLSRVPKEELHHYQPIPDLQKNYSNVLALLY